MLLRMKLGKGGGVGGAVESLDRVTLMSYKMWTTDLLTEHSTSAECLLSIVWIFEN